MEWWDGFFDGDYPILFAPVLVLEQTASIVAGVQAMLDLPPGSEVLDLACGQGRITVPLAKAGWHMTGLDWSETMLAEARAAARVAEVEIEFVRRDMRDVPWNNRFDAVISIFTSFGYFGDEEDQKVLEAIYGALKPGGKFLIDLIHRDQVTTSYPLRKWHEVDGISVWSEHSFDPVSGWLGETYHWHNGSTIQSRRARFRPYSATELEKMLRLAGLESVAIYGDWQQSRFSKNCSLISLSKKKDNV